MECGRQRANSNQVARSCRQSCIGSTIDICRWKFAYLSRQVANKQISRLGSIISTHRYRHRYRYNQRSEEHTSELQSLMRISYAVFCLKKKTQPITEDVSAHAIQQDANTLRSHNRGDRQNTR